MKRVPLSEAWTGIADCSVCAIRRSVLFAGLEVKDFDELHRPIDQLSYAPGGQIYSSGDPILGVFCATDADAHVLHFAAIRRRTSPDRPDEAHGGSGNSRHSRSRTPPNGFSTRPILMKFQARRRTVV